MGYPWHECRQTYCDTFETALQSVLHEAGPLYYDDKDLSCRPFTQFNKTLCMQHYRDADAWCDCFCPTLDMLDEFTGTSTCSAEIVNFLVLGRKGPPLAATYAIQGWCSPMVCDWFAHIGDPNP